MITEQDIKQYVQKCWKTKELSELLTKFEDDLEIKIKTKRPRKQNNIKW